MIETWGYCWASAIFHEFDTHVPGWEVAQVRKEEAVTRHFRLRCVAQSLLQWVPASEETAERFALAQGEATVGPRVRTIARDALHGLLQLVEQLFVQGRSGAPRVCLLYEHEPKEKGSARLGAYVRQGSGASQLGYRRFL